MGEAYETIILPMAQACRAVATWAGVRLSTVRWYCSIQNYTQDNIAQETQDDLNFVKGNPQELGNAVGGTRFTTRNSGALHTSQQDSSG